MTSASPQREALVLGRYDLVSRIASGGAGSVFLARDLRDSCDVVVKFIDAREDAMDGWVREMRIALRLSHPSVVRCRNVGFDESLGAWALVYDYASGGSLRRALVRDGALGDQVASRMLQDVAAALAYAHGRGVVHRDVKPENIVKTGSDSSGWQLTDFGDSRFLARGSIAETVVGSLSYMAPETFLGRTTQLSDQYALGVVAVECLRGGVQSRGSLRDVSGQSTLERVVCQMLSPHPSDRFPTMEVVCALVESSADVQWLVNDGSCGIYDGTEVSYWCDDQSHRFYGQRFERFVRGAGPGIGAKIGHRLVRLGPTRKTIYADESPYTPLCFDASGDGWIARGDELCRISPQGIEVTASFEGVSSRSGDVAWGDQRRLFVASRGSRTGLIARLQGSTLRLEEIELPLPVDAVGSVDGHGHVLAADGSQTIDFALTDDGELREVARYPVPRGHARYDDNQVSLVRSFDTAEFFSQSRGGQ